ncbi:uncharacterized protein KY384_003584 [Bacidia gigantensis]|uniref:uncharacterized protein n=1 Tax=Bacidia gigantensis TaxID=2732470 RepID=UPI001D046714|nr:uncharacterized protein KY384_003584 [Bacidia gigantensis]KAG8531948.1 hypothetical protein KY384_003584 [Bacidia gigantensis]
MASSDDTYYAYFDSTSVPSYIRAVELLGQYVDAEGPFDGVLAFSQGAGLAAMYIVHKLLQDPNRAPPFKVAILISCLSVYDPVTWYERGEVRTMDPAKDGQVISIPTAHIWGQQDSRNPESKAIYQMADHDLRSISVHEGGHEVPSTGTQGAIGGAVKAIRRAVTRATL